MTLFQRETNRKARAQNIEFSVNEIYAFIGMVLYAGVTKSNSENYQDLWNNHGHPIFRSTMSRNRYVQLKTYLRFDNGLTRAERVKTDKGAAISDLLRLLNANLKRYYIPGVNVTVDEQLFAFRGRCGFIVYIPSKPAKYGIKMWWVNDSQSSYPYEGQLYTGLAPSGERDVGQGQRIIRELCIDNFKGSGRNVTCDNFFTTYDLAEELKSNNLSLLGTVNQRRRLIPKELLPSKDRELYSTEFVHSENIVLCSYFLKRKKAVVVLSTSHYDLAIEDESIQKTANDLGLQQDQIRNRQDGPNAGFIYMSQKD